jgi:ribosome-associated translation inhibitor RaiA
MPERRLPYSMHIVSLFEDGRHLPSEGAVHKFVRSKIAGALEHTEDFVLHVEAALHREDHFHVLKPNHKPVKEETAKHHAHKDASLVAPYNLQVVITMKHGAKEVIYNNPEKHAKPTITEAVDDAADAIRRMTRQMKEKARDGGKRKAQKRDSLREEADLDTAMSMVAEIPEESHILDTPLADSAVEDLYEKVEAKVNGDEEAPKPKRAAPPASAPKVQVKVPEEKIEIADFLLR